MRENNKITVLITGVDGFVGANLKTYLTQFEQYQVHGLLRHKTDKPQFVNLHYIHDFSDLEPLKQIPFDVVIHLAGKAHDLKKVSLPEAYYQDNTELTKTVFDFFEQSNAKKFIYLSSVKAVADEVNGILSEDAMPNPLTHYGKSKRQAETYLIRKFSEEKLIYILRSCMIHGAKSKGNLQLLYKLVQKGIPYPLATFQNKRSILSIDNLCFVMHELITQNNVESGIYNIADDTPLSTNRMVEIMAKALNKKPRLWYIPPAIIRTIAKIGDIFDPFPLNSERLQKLTESYVVDNTKIIKALDKKLPITAEDGLMKTIQALNNSKKEH